MLCIALITQRNNESARLKQAARITFDLGERYLFQCGLTGVELEVPTFFGEQAVVVAALGDLAMLQNDDGASITDGGKTVSNNKHCSAFHERVHALFDQTFSTRVNGARCFVEDHDRRVGDVGAGNREQLALSL